MPLCLMECYLAQLMRVGYFFDVRHSAVIVHMCTEADADLVMHDPYDRTYIA